MSDRYFQEKLKLQRAKLLDQVPLLEAPADSTTIAGLLLRYAGAVWDQPDAQRQDNANYARTYHMPHRALPGVTLVVRQDVQKPELYSAGKQPRLKFEMRSVELASWEELTGAQVTINEKEVAGMRFDLDDPFIELLLHHFETNALTRPSVLDEA